MGVLEARKDAEKIGFPVVGETTKDNSDVVDYNIREEQTIEQSSVFDANNNTTTGMANVIPGVNAPKLIESTSIYNNVPNKTAYVKFSGSGNTLEGGDHTGQLRPLTISDQGGAYTYVLGKYFNGYVETTDSCIIIPASGVYEVTCTYYSSVNVFYRNYDIYLNLDIVYHLQNDSYYDQTGSAYPTETFYLNANKGDQFAIIYNIYNGMHHQNMGWSVNVTMTKIS